MLVESKAPSNLHGHTNNSSLRSSRDGLSLLSSELLKRLLDTHTGVDMCYKYGLYSTNNINIRSVQSAKKKKFHINTLRNTKKYSDIRVALRAHLTQAYSVLDTLPTSYY